MNGAKLEQYVNGARLEKIRIESNYSFVSPTQVIDLPKERLKDDTKTK